MITVKVDKSVLFDEIIITVEDAGFIPSANDIKELSLRLSTNNIHIKKAFECTYHLADWYVCNQRKLSDLADFIDYDEVANWLLADDSYVELESGHIVLF